MHVGCLYSVDGRNLAPLEEDKFHLTSRTLFNIDGEACGCRGQVVQDFRELNPFPRVLAINIKKGARGF